MPKTDAAKAFVPKRGRPTAKQVAAIEQTILSTARNMFLEDGYDAVAMENVAMVAGVSKGTLYARHPSKEALFTAIVEDRVKQWSATASQQDHLLTDDIRERLRHHGHTIAQSISEPEVHAFQRLLLSTRDRFPELSKAMYEVGYLYIVQLITRDSGAAAERDGVPARQPEAIARMFVSGITGWQLQESGARPIPLDEMIAAADRTVDLFMAARSNW
ncbi:TetR/AcrR family transcriptional regulator [Sphingobium sp.]|uniref:TetR/AcrR family transcriptional regulator n=1 Tax=Sphingobium sp. TaxID=1912891 RepID=UPI002CDC4587|nr:TetR/AcrR family transcriptional regulator [Sphingobium sp.]HUD90892.1 TetR/AcrR family transcriptional regulator [Sphingobium sp.]